MLSASSPDLPQKSLQIKKDDKFFIRLLSKETSMANSSFRVVSAGSVPFLWESLPGTPKHKFSETTLPPLTPPPSFYFNSSKKPAKKHPRSHLLHSLLPRINFWKNDMSSSSPSSPSSSSWSSSSSSSSPMFVPMTVTNNNGRRRFSTSGSLFDFRADEEEEASIGSPTSTLCFGLPSCHR